MNSRRYTRTLSGWTRFTLAFMSYTQWENGPGKHIPHGVHLCKRCDFRFNRNGFEDANESELSRS